MSENTSLLSKFDAYGDLANQLSDSGLDPTSVVIDRILTATTAIINGRETILAGTNNYLGITFNDACIKAGQQALATSGTGTTGSRMANGSYSAHLKLEEALADFYGCDHGMIFSTGYAANLGTLCALLGKDDVALLDSDAHASLYDGCRLSGADVFRFKHNDPESLNKRLRRLSDRASRTLVIVEGLYSVLGDLAPLREFTEITAQYGAFLLVDEAHSLGMFGSTGRGVAQAQGVEDKVDFTVGTFSKSLGATGGFCVSSRPELALFRYASRPYIFTASPSPSVIATTTAALEHIRQNEGLKTTLWHNVKRLHAGFSALGLDLGAPPSPVIAVKIGPKPLAVACWRRLLDAGVYCNLMVPPAAPDNNGWLRCSVSAAHTDDQVDDVIRAFEFALGPAAKTAS